MKPGKKTAFLKGDFLVAVIILCLAGIILFFIFFPQTEKKYCIIRQNNVIIKQVELEENFRETITVSGEYHNVLEIENGRVRMKRSDCPNHDCVSSGWISQSGQAIFCLPNRVSVTITSEQEQEVDAIVR